MGKREPLGRDPLEWIKRTKPADGEEQPTAEARPGEGAQQPAPPHTPETPPPQGQKSWLDSIAAAETQTPPQQQPVEQQPPAAPEATAPAPAAVAPAQADLGPASEAPPTPQVPAPEAGPIHVQAPEPPSPAWPAAVVQEPPAGSGALPSAVAQPDEEEPTEILGVGGEEEEVTAEKLKAEAHYVHVGSTDDEVSTLPKLDTEEYAATGFPLQERSLLFPIIMVVCIFLMGLLVYMWAETRMRGIEQRLTRIEKKLDATRPAQE